MEIHNNEELIERKCRIKLIKVEKRSFNQVKKKVTNKVNGLVRWMDWSAPWIASRAKEHRGRQKMTIHVADTLIRTDDCRKLSSAED